MKKLVLGAMLILAVSAVCFAQRTNSQAKGRSTQPDLPGGTGIEAELQQDIIFKSAKLGDEVALLTTKDIRQGDKLIAAKGTKVIARIVNAIPKTAANAMGFEIIFERIRNETLNAPLNASIIAITEAKKTPAKTVAGPVKGLKVVVSADPMSLGVNVLSSPLADFKLPKGVNFQLKVNGAPATK